MASLGKNTYVLYRPIIYEYIAGIPRMVPNLRTVIGIYRRKIVLRPLSGVQADDKIIIISRAILRLIWGEPFNNLNPIVNYTVSCSGDVSCPPNFTTTDNTTRRYTMASLITMTNYTFSVVATNSIGSGEAAVVTTTFPGIFIVCT